MTRRISNRIASPIARGSAGSGRARRSRGDSVGVGWVMAAHLTLGVGWVGWLVSIPVHPTIAAVPEGSVREPVWKSESFDATAQPGPVAQDRTLASLPRGCRLGEQRVHDRVDVRLLGHDDQRVDHAEHAVRAFGVRQDVAVERPDAGRLGVDQDVVALTRVDAEGVARERGAAERPAVARDRPASASRGGATGAS